MMTNERVQCCDKMRIGKEQIVSEEMPNNLPTVLLTLSYFDNVVWEYNFRLGFPNSLTSV